MNHLTAVSTWRSLAHLEDLSADLEADLDNAERIILSRQPESIDDLIDQLAVIAAQCGDGRSDGLDAEALERLVAFAKTSLRQD